MPEDITGNSGQPAEPLEGVLDSIRRMTASVRFSVGEVTQADFDEGWWVLAVGEDLGAAPFAERERARERLRQEVEGAGVVLAEYVWVWDESRAAQLVLSTLPSLERAQRVAERLRAKGLQVRVTRQTI